MFFELLFERDLFLLITLAKPTLIRLQNNNNSYIGIFNIQFVNTEKILTNYSYLEHLGFIESDGARVRYLLQISHQSLLRY